MTVTDQLKIIDNKIKANQAQYYLDRLASKISAYSSGDLKNVSPQTKTNENLREKVLGNVGDFFNELYYIYKDKYNEEINSLNTRDTKIFNYKKLRLTGGYQYESEEEKEQTSKKSNKKEPPKKPIKTDVRELNEFITKKETGMNRELFKIYFNFQMPTAILKALYTFNDRKKNNDLVDIIKSGLSDLKNEIERMSDDELKIGKSCEIVNIVEKILEFNRQN